MQILFVCTGNTCRSPMAEGFMNKISSQKSINSIAVSAGISVYPLSCVSPFSVAVMNEYDIDISSHNPTQLNDEHIKNADLILTMTSSHAAYLKMTYPESLNKIFSLGEYTLTHDVSDPYGQGQDVYGKCAEEIRKAVIILCESIKSK